MVRRSIYDGGPPPLNRRDSTLELEIDYQRNLCRVMKDKKYGGYKKDILIEKMTDKDKHNALLTCKVCDGIMREACITSDGKQICSCCAYGYESAYNSPRQIPNVAVREMVISLKCCCPLSNRGCKWLGTLGTCEDHLDTCGYVHVRCDLECGEVLQRNNLKVHKEKSSYRMVKCDHCSSRFKFCEMSKHLDKCPGMIVSCDLKCGLTMARREKPRHEANVCSQKQFACTLGCGMMIKRNELSTHVSDKCEQRKIPCDHCKHNFKFCEMNVHHTECPRMIVACELKCGRSMVREDVARHVEQECVEKVVECPFVEYKCEAKIKRKHVNKHLEEKETKHLGLKLAAMEEKQNRMYEQMNVLSSMSNITTLTWDIDNILDFIRKQHSPEQHRVDGHDINIHFYRDNICVKNWHSDSGDSLSAKILIRLYSTIKCKVLREYNCGTVKISDQLTYPGYVGRNVIDPFSGYYESNAIASFTSGYAEELSRTGLANKLILEMYIRII